MSPIRSSLALATLLATLPAPRAAGDAAVPPEVAAFVERREACDHFRGEEPYDVERAEFLARRIDETCTGTDEALRRLRAKYPDDRVAQRLLAGFEEGIESPCGLGGRECRCRRALGERYPGWGAPVLSVEMQRFADALKTDPAVARGDFDDDGREDVAFLFDAVSGSDRLAIAACLSSLGAAAPVVIEEPYCADGISRVPKGASYYDIDQYTGREEHYPRDAINAYCYEKAAASYLFENGAFRRVVVSD